MSLIKIVALGGVQEMGKNLYVVEVDGSMFILDAGMKYPPSDVYGVDIVLPDVTYLMMNYQKIRGIFLTHAHDDHIGAVPGILSYLNVPVYGSKFTIAVLKDLLIENKMDPKNYSLNVVDAKDEPLRFGRTIVKFINVSHSIPGSMAIAIKTMDGYVVYTGNYNFDQNGGLEYQTDIAALCDLQKEGVLALLPESIGSINEINRESIVTFVSRLNKVFLNAKGRIIISLFSTNLQRIQQIIDIATKFNKKIAISGRKTQRIVKTALELGYLKADEGRLVTLKYIDDKNKNEDPNLVYVVTGERHEPYFLLQRLCKGVDRLIRLNEDDTVAILTRPQIGVEKIAARTLDMLYQKTLNIFQMPSELILSASAGYEESKQMINILKPKYLMPAVGEYRHQFNIVKLAKEIGFPQENIYILESGNQLSISEGNMIGVIGVTPSGDLMLDGRGLGDVGDAVLRDREILASDGFLMFVANVSAKKRKVLTKPKVISRGFFFEPEDETDMIEIFNNITAEVFNERFISWVDYKSNLKSELSKYIFKKTKISPLIIPVIISTELPEEEDE